MPSRRETARLAIPGTIRARQIRALDIHNGWSWVPAPPLCQIAPEWHRPHRAHLARRILAAAEFPNQIVDKVPPVDHDIGLHHAEDRKAELRQGRGKPVTIYGYQSRCALELPPRGAHRL